MNLAESSKIHISMEFKPGDIQFVNNGVLLHSRTEFEDDELFENRRHLLRQWLNVREGVIVDDDAFPFRLGIPKEVSVSLTHR